MAEYIDRQDLDFLNDFCIDSGKYVGLKLDDVFDELATTDVIEREKVNKAIEEMESIEDGLVMECDEMRDYCVDILKRHLEE